MSFFDTPEFKKHQKIINTRIESLPYQDSSEKWTKRDSIVIGGLTYIGFSDDSSHLLVVSSSGRSVFDLAQQKRVARDYTEDGDWLDERNLLCIGIGPLEDQSIRIAGIGGGGLPTHTYRGESLYLASPDFPCHDVVYQPPNQHCLLDKRNENCFVLYKGFINCYGFSWDGNTMVVVDEDIHLWRSENEN